MRRDAPSTGADGRQPARRAVREIVGASHYVTDLTLGLGEVVFDYLKDGWLKDGWLKEAEPL